MPARKKLDLEKLNASLATDTEASAAHKKRPLPKCWSGHSYEVGTFLYFFDALIFAHLARCAAAILFLPAADILRRARVVFFALRSSRCRTSVNFSISFRISCAMDSRLIAAPRFAVARIACISGFQFDQIGLGLIYNAFRIS